MQKVSCIVPAYNEASRIANVLSVLHTHPALSEVIVVDDGSQDTTTEIVRGSFPGVRLIVHEKNQGKNMAMYTGATNATGEIVMFIDADLEGLTEQNITDLLEPVLSGKARWSLSMRSNTPWHFKKLGLDYISGERVFHTADLAPVLEDFKHISGYGIETFLNLFLIKKGYSCKVVFWANARFPWKSEKVGFWKGVKGELKMYWELNKVTSVFKIPWIIYRMRKLMV
jgi:glycosyltransferase involved in cell wall biosynthesis